MADYRDFSGGLFVSGPRDSSPPNTMRRLRGTNPVIVNMLRSRDFDRLLSTTPDDTETVNSAVRFGDAIYFFTTAGNVYRHIDGNPPVLIHSGLTGARVNTAIMPPTQGAADALFVTEASGGTSLIKILLDGTVEQWGIDAPPDGFTATSGGTNLQDMLVNINPLNLPPSASTNFDNATPLPAITLDRYLSHTPGFPSIMSSLSDYITFDVRITNVACVDSIVLLIDLDDGTFVNFFSAFIALNGYIPAPGVTSVAVGTRSGIKQMVHFNPDKVHKPEIVYPNVSFGGFQTAQASENTGATIRIPKSVFNEIGAPDWGQTLAAVRLIVSTNATAHTGPISFFAGDFFLQGGFGMQGGDVGYRITYRNSTTGARSNPNATQFVVPDPLRGYVSLKSLPIYPPQPLDPQVDQLEIWRTQAGGVEWFLVEQFFLTDLHLLTNETYNDGSSDFLALNYLPAHPSEGTVSTVGAATEITLSSTVDALAVTKALNTVDEINDYIIPHLSLQDPTTHLGRVIIHVTIAGVETTRTIIGFGTGGSHTFLLDFDVDWSTNPTFTFEIPFSILQTFALPLTNVPPEKEFHDVCGPVGGRLWWLSNDPKKRGRAYYSAAGLPESVEGWIEPFNNTDPLTKLIFWNASVWATTEGLWYQIQGEDAPFSFFEIFGTKGTTRPFTVVPTTGGIFYWAGDGVRMFDGVQSQLAAFTAMAYVFRGQTAESILPFEGEFACARPDEYLIADSQSTLLGLRISTGSWREVGGVGLLPPSALYYDRRLDRVLAGVGNQLFTLEEKGNDLGTTPITYECETPGERIGINQVGLQRRLFIDILTTGQDVTPVIVTDKGLETLPDFNTPTRQVVEIPRTINGHILGVRLTATILQPIECYGITTDVDPAIPTSTPLGTPAGEKALQ